MNTWTTKDRWGAGLRQPDGRCRIGQPEWAFTPKCRSKGDPRYFHAGRTLRARRPTGTYGRLTQLERPRSQRMYYREDPDPSTGRATPFICECLPADLIGPDGENAEAIREDPSARVHRETSQLPFAAGGAAPARPLPSGRSGPPRPRHGAREVRRRGTAPEPSGGPRPGILRPRPPARR